MSLLFKTSATCNAIVISLQRQENVTFMIYRTSNVSVRELYYLAMCFVVVSFSKSKINSMS